MLFKLIACEVFTREVCYCVARSPHVVDLEFTPKGAHNDPAYLRKMLQDRIDAAHASDKHYDAILLCFGVCGNSTVGLANQGIPFVIPRAHDCCTLFLGSKDRYKDFFGQNPSQAFSSAGYMEHGGDFVRETDEIKKQIGLDKNYEECVRKYGEENAKYIWETLHLSQDTQPQDNKVVFIEVPEFRHLGYAEQCRQKAEVKGKQFVQLEGSINLIRKLIFGEWDETDFLVLSQNESIIGVYDLDEVIRAVRKDCLTRQVQRTAKSAAAELGR